MLEGTNLKLCVCTHLVFWINTAVAPSTGCQFVALNDVANASQLTFSSTVFWAHTEEISHFYTFSPTSSADVSFETENKTQVKKNKCHGSFSKKVAGACCKL